MRYCRRPVATFLDRLRKISSVPTNPRAPHRADAFDIAELYRGAITDPAASSEAVATPFDEKLRQAYFWIVNTAIISPHYDVEYNDGPPASYVLGDSKSRMTLPSAQSYSSFVLLPLLTFATRRKCLFVGGPGRGKTASAILMGVLAGYPLREVRRAMQHGHPQMTIADLLGNPLPADLVNAQSMDDIRIAWRQLARHAGQDRRRVQPHPDPHAERAADGDGGQLRRDLGPDLRVPRVGLVPDRERRSPAAAPTR